MYLPISRLGALALATVVSTAQAAGELKVTVDLSAGPLRTFIPAETFGAGIDGHDRGSTSKLLRGANLGRMRAAGFGPVSYRLRTELAVEAWHWNPAGKFSHKDRAEGYWTSDATPVPGRPIEISNGYRLPRRGSSIDQANNNGYSRLDDGDDASFWKSNPYLDQQFTHEPNDLHLAWVVLDLGEPTALDALHIDWGEPYARSLAVEYCTNIHADYVENRICDTWEPFPQGQFEGGSGGSETHRLAPAPLKARFVRLLLRDSAYAGPPTDDIRDTLGYAIREVGVGRIAANGTFQDEVKHAPSSGRQTTVITSSTDPWHRARDRDRDTEQPGFDAFYRSGLAGAVAPMIPVPLLYDTPENAAAEIAYLRKAGYPIGPVEMGEEPDGQYVTPEDYGALYLQFADALQRVDPELKLGGPGFQTSIDGYRSWPIGAETRPWITRFMDYLKARGREASLSFFSFEWYPFDDCCGDTALQLAVHPRILDEVLTGLRSQGLPRDLPWMITEYGYSAFACRAEVDLEGALFNAETLGLALQQGAARVFLYGLEPAALMDELDCHSWGNNTLFVADDDWRIRSPTAAYHAARMINSEWVGPSSEPHALFPVRVEGARKFGLERVSAFALRLPDGHWSLLVLNKDPTDSYDLRIEFQAGEIATSAEGPVEIIQLSNAQYQWAPKGAHGTAKVNRGPEVRTEPGLPIQLPPYSINIIRLGANAGH
ncbi:MAG: discoidin domain-containing protein [Chromatiaceae bacterium]